MRSAATLLLLPTALWLFGGPALPRAAAAEDASAIESRRFDALRDLPDGDGKTLTAVACSRCHDLGGLASYKGYWTRTQWLAMVESMVKNGAVLDTAQVQVVTDYLTRQYGRPPPP